MKAKTSAKRNATAHSSMLRGSQFVPIGKGTVLAGGKTAIEIDTISENLWLATHLRQLADQVQNYASGQIIRARLQFEVAKHPRLLTCFTLQE